MANFRYKLDSAKGKGTCPSCGQKRRFSYYFDSYTGERVNEVYGKCDRAESCGYHRYPKRYDPELEEYLKEYSKIELKEYLDTHEIPSSKKELVYLTEKDFDYSYNQGNPFIKFLESVIGDYIEVYKLCKRMNVKTDKDDTIFVYQDLQGRFTRGKIMKFHSNGHRNGDNNSIHSKLKVPKDKLPELHLFGLHLLNLPENRYKTVAIVESEKTAILTNYFYPENVWMATSGLGNLTKERLQPLEGRKIILYPDVKEAYSNWLEKVEKESLQNYYDIELNNCLEGVLYSGKDIADYISCFRGVEDIEMIERGDIVFNELLISEETFNSFGNLPEEFEFTPKPLKRFHVDGKFYYQRFEYYLKRMPREDRKKITIDGEETIEVDAQALHPRILGKLFNEHTGLPIPEFLKGDSYSKLGEFLGLERPQAKEVNVSYWNAEIDSKNLKTIDTKGNYPMLFRKMDEFLIEKSPELFEWLLEIKCEMKAINGTEPHSNMYFMMTDREVRIMNELICKIYEKGNKCIYVADAVFVKKSIAEEVSKIFEAILEEHLTENKKRLAMVS